MNLFTAPDVDVLSSYSFTELAASRTGVSKVSRGSGQAPELILSPDRGSPVDLSTQFILFQLNSKMSMRSKNRCADLWTERFAICAKTRTTSAWVAANSLRPARVS